MNGSIAVQVIRRFNVSPERIFDAWLDPALISQWMFGPRLRDEKILRIHTEAREGGRFSFKVLRDGQEIDHIGEYLEIDRPKRLAFTWGIEGESDGESQVTIELTPIDQGCEFTLTHTLDQRWSDYADRVRTGWTSMTNALAILIAEQDNKS